MGKASEITHSGVWTPEIEAYWESLQAEQVEAENRRRTAESNPKSKKKLPKGMRRLRWASIERPGWPRLLRAMYRKEIAKVRAALKK
jgi:hypothetical protein